MIAGVFILRRFRYGYYLFHPFSNKKLEYFLQKIIYNLSIAIQKYLKEIDRSNNDYKCKNDGTPKDMIRA